MPIANSQSKISAAAIADHYDFFLPIYRLLWGDHIHHGLFRRGNESPQEAQEQMIAHCVERAGMAGAAKVLDVGCGHGGVAVYLAARMGSSVHGITLSQRQAQRARRNAARAGVTEQVTIDVANAEATDFPAAAYDVVWTMESSEHFHDKAAYFRRAANALKPGGALVLAAWTGDPARERVRKVAEWGLCAGLQTAQQYAEQMAAAGLVLRQQEDLTAQVERTWEICMRRARWLWPALPFLPRRHRHFARGMSTILEAYGSGDLTYTAIFAGKP